MGGYTVAMQVGELLSEMRAMRESAKRMGQSVSKAAEAISELKEQVGSFERHLDRVSGLTEVLAQRQDTIEERVADYGARIEALEKKAPK